MEFKEKLEMWANASDGDR